MRSRLIFPTLTPEAKNRLAMAAVLIAMALFFASLLGWLLPNDKQRALCDQAVAALLQSDSSVEIERSGIIIRRLDCSISTRIPK